VVAVGEVRVETLDGLGLESSLLLCLLEVRSVLDARELLELVRESLLASELLLVAVLEDCASCGGVELSRGNVELVEQRFELLSGVVVALAGSTVGKGNVGDSGEGVEHVGDEVVDVEGHGVLGGGGAGGALGAHLDEFVDAWDAVLTEDSQDLLIRHVAFCGVRREHQHLLSHEDAEAPLDAGGEHHDVGTSNQGVESQLPVDVGSQKSGHEAKLEAGGLGGGGFAGAVATAEVALEVGDIDEGQVEVVAVNEPQPLAAVGGAVAEPHDVAIGLLPHLLDEVIGEVSGGLVVAASLGEVSGALGEPRGGYGEEGHAQELEQHHVGW